ncbi:MAG TPA: phage major capsid protein, partial [Vicinamibacterales bacterium]|nr:phage major capsid protein [Vicinamibacterales bacterium]
VYERQLDTESELRGSQGVLAGRGDSDPNAGNPAPQIDPEKAKAEERAAFRAWARGGQRALNAEQAARVEKRNAAMPAEIRALSALSDSAGAYTIADTMYPSLVEAQKSYVGLRQPGAATVLTTSNGAPLAFITDNDTSNKGEILAENTAASSQDVAFGRVTLNAYIFSSKLVLVPIALLQDSEFDLESYLFRKFGERIGRKQNDAFTTGSGANEPYGLLSQSTNGKTAAGTDSFTWLELMDLKHSVDPAYRANGPMWMWNDTTLKALKKLLDGQGRPLWQSGVALREPDTFDGDRYVINQSMASPATGTKPIAYGDLKHYHIRDVSGAIVLALRERYAEKMQVGFIAFSRHDGALVDAGTNPVKHLTMA